MLIPGKLLPEDSIVPVLVIVAPDPSFKTIAPNLSATGFGEIVPVPVIVPELTIVKFVVPPPSIAPCVPEYIVPEFVIVTGSVVSIKKIAQHLTVLIVPLLSIVIVLPPEILSSLSA